jgi:hypothetical protein
MRRREPVRATVVPPVMRETDQPGVKARKPNPALEPLTFLIGDWQTTGTHPLVPGEELRGRTCFAWHEGGAFLSMQSSVYHPQFPDGIAIIGSDNSNGSLTMIYFDERGISRTMQVTTGEREVTWHHDDPKFAQRLTIKAEGDVLVSRGLMSEDGGPWTDDLSQRFTPLPPKG